MKRKIFSVLIALVLVLGMSMVTAVPVAGATTAEQEAAVIAAADRLVGVQNEDGGFPWKAPPDGPSTTNCQGVTAMGIMEAWKIEAKPIYVTALALAYKFVVDKEPAFTWSEVDSRYNETTKGVDSFPDVTFLLELASAANSDAGLLAAIAVAVQVPDIGPGDISDLARSRWDGRVNHLGATIENDPSPTATAMAEYLRDVVRHPDYDAILPWDLESAIEAALALDNAYSGQGYYQQAIDIAGVVHASIDDTLDGGACRYFSSTDDTQNDYILGLAGAILAYERLGLHETEVAAYLALLLANQQPGGYWNYHGTTPAEKGVQSTAYAALALFKEGTADARTAANNATNWLVSSQQAGGWYGDVTPECASTVECYEVNGEAARALAVIGGVSIELNEAWYETLDTVYVTVEDAAATDWVKVNAISDSDAVGTTATLTETGTNTGVFEGSFLLVPPPRPEPPNLGELVVEDDNLITVTYLGATDTATVDDTLPEIYIELVTTPTNDPVQTITGTFTELNLAAITLTINGGSRTVTVNEGLGTWEAVDAALQLGDNFIVATITDLIGNEATAEAYIEFDNREPVVTIVIPEYINLANVGAVPVTITSDEDGSCECRISDGFTAYVRTVPIEAGVAVDLQFELDQLADGAILATADVTDNAGNVGHGEDPAWKDTVTPGAPSALTITDPINSIDQLNVTLSGMGEPVATVAYSIIDEIGGEVTGEGFCEFGTFTITPIDVSILADGILIALVTQTDEAGNTSLPVFAEATKKASLPTVLIATEAPDPTNISPIVLTATFSEGVTDFTEDDITVGNGTITRFTDEHAPVYRFTVVPDADGLVTVDIDAGVAFDWANNPNQAARPFSITYDATAPEVAVTSPNGGENWLGGSTQTITWTATDANFGATPIIIKYSINGGNDWDTIAAKVANISPFSWVVPNLSSSNCLVRVVAVDLAGNIGIDGSNSKFTITSDTVAPAVTVNSPNGGENWQGGSTRIITWTATDDKTPSGDLLVELAFSPNGGTIWVPIDFIEGNMGAYSWTVPTINSNQCLVRVAVSDTSGNAGYDVSDNVFTITTPGAPVTTIELETGWNLISLMLIPTSSNITDVLEGIDVVSVWAYDASIEDPAERWSSYVPGEVPGDLETMVDGKGYWINMSEPAVLTIEGQELPDPPDFTMPAYSVVEGWNLIGFKSTIPRAAGSYLLAIDGKYTLVRGYDGSYFIVGTGENLGPGSGYWISITEPGTIYP